MKYTVLFFLLNICTHLSSQVVDSTFGIPASFEGPWQLYYGITGCDFDGRDDRAFSVLHLDDGKIILAGYTRGSDGNDFALVRLLPDGKYDETAGTNGEIRIDLGHQNDSCLTAVRYPGDRILMGGCVTLPERADYVNLLVRTDFDGNPDPAFGNNGQAIIDLPSDYEMIVKIQPLQDGKVLIAGNALFGLPFQFPDSTAVFVGRLHPDGKVDSTFGLNGFIYRRYEQTCNISLLGDLIVDQGNHILFTGASYDPYPGNYNGDDDCKHNIVVFRLQPSGLPDPLFGNNGRVELPYSEGRGNALQVYENGKILLTGVVSDLLTEPVYTFMARLLPDGTLDSTFGAHGRVRKFLLGGFSASEPMGILRMNDKIILGYVDEPNGDHPTFGLMRFTETGKIDSTFGNMGIFSSVDLYAWVSYNIHSFTTVDSESIFIGGYYSILGHYNMMISKVKLNGPTIGTTEAAIQNLKIFPNPVIHETFYLDLSGVTAPNKMRLYIRDVHGRAVAEQALQSAGTVQQVEVSHLPNGLYFAELVSGDVRYRSKLLIQR